MLDMELLFNVPSNKSFERIAKSLVKSILKANSQCEKIINGQAHLILQGSSNKIIVYFNYHSGQIWFCWDGCNYFSSKRYIN